MRKGIQMERLVIWFSCGAASAVTAKLSLAKYAGAYEMKIVRCVVANEHPDNDRFAADCEKWFGIQIHNISSDEYADCWEVWQKARFLSGIHGAPCTTEMKKRVRFKFESDWHPDVQAYGYTCEEQDRADRFRQNNPEIDLITPLIDGLLSKSDCLGILTNVGIELPEMYKLGFNNNNCIGCVKGGMGYWNRIRVHFPETYERMARLERELGHAINRRDDSPIYLDELPPDAGRHVEPNIDCSLFCHGAERIIGTAESA